MDLWLATQDSIINKMIFEKPFLISERHVFHMSHLGKILHLKHFQKNLIGGNSTPLYFFLPYLETAYARNFIQLPKVAEYMVFSLTSMYLTTLAVLYFNYTEKFDFLPKLIFK